MDEYQSFLRSIPSQPAIRNAMAKVAEKEEQGLPVIDFTSGNVGKLPLHLKLFSKMELEVNNTLPDELQAISAAISTGLNASFNPKPRALSYSPAGGTSSLKRYVLRYFRDVHGVPLTEDNLDRVIVTSGGQRCMTAALRSLKPATKVVLNRWDYSAVSTIVEEHGCDVVRLNGTDDFSLNIKEINETVEDEAVFYLSMPNNPTGYVSARDLEQIASLMTDRGGGIIWDAPYIFTILKLRHHKAEFNKQFEGTMIKEFQRISKRYYEKMCILSSLSKTCLLAGLRIGFGTASSHWIKIMSSIVGREDLSSPTPTFIIGECMLQRFLENPSINRWLCNILANRLTILIEENFPLILPKNGAFGALYVLIDTGKEDGVTFTERLLNQYGIAVVPGEPFYGGPVNAVRLSLVATPWVMGDEEWVKNVRSLKKVFFKMKLI